MTPPDYLACTKAPPSDYPEGMTKGLSSCVAPRNHDGPCQYPTADGGRAMLFEGRANPVTMVAEIERLYFRTRRAYRVAFWCSIVSAMSAGWLLVDVIRSVAG